MEPCKHVDFECLHDCCFVWLGMVMTQQMQRAMHHQQSKLVGQLLGCLRCDFGADHNVAEHRWLPIGDGMAAIDPIDGKGKNIGRTRATHVVAVELCHLVYRDEGQSDLGFDLTMLACQRGREHLNEMFCIDFVRLLAVIDINMDVSRTSRRGTTAHDFGLGHCGVKFEPFILSARIVAAFLCGFGVLALLLIVLAVCVDDGPNNAVANDIAATK